MSPTSDLPPLGKVKLLQINLNHCTTANDNAKNYIIENFIDIALLQDAPCNKEGTLTRFSKNKPSFPSINNKAHVVVGNVELVYSHHYTGSNCAFMTIMAKEVTILIGNSYDPLLTSRSPWTNGNTLPYRGRL